MTIQLLFERNDNSIVSIWVLILPDTAFHPPVLRGGGFPAEA
jgi:hypothetical protein